MLALSKIVKYKKIKDDDLPDSFQQIKITKIHVLLYTYVSNYSIATLVEKSIYITVYEISAGLPVKTVTN